MTARHPPNTIPHLVWVQYIGIISVALGMLKNTLKTPTFGSFSKGKTRISEEFKDKSVMNLRPRSVYRGKTSKRPWCPILRPEVALKWTKINSRTTVLLPKALLGALSINIANNQYGECKDIGNNQCFLGNLSYCPIRAFSVSIPFLIAKSCNRCKFGHYPGKFDWVH